MRASPAEGAGPKHGFGDRERFAVSGHVVHPEEGHALLIGEYRCRHRAEEALSGHLYARDLSYEPLARGTDEDRETQIYDSVQILKERQVVPEVLPEADAGIHDYVLGPDTRRDGILGPPREELPDLAHHVLVVGFHLHGLRLALHVHQDHGACRFVYH